MYNVEEAYLHTIKYGGQTFEKLSDYVEQSIKKQITKGEFYQVFSLEHKDYPLQDILRLENYLKYLGYYVYHIDLTNDVTQIRVTWTDMDVEDYLNKDTKDGLDKNGN